MSFIVGLFIEWWLVFMWLVMWCEKFVLLLVVMMKLY